jgi:hypothetical protein
MQWRLPCRVIESSDIFTMDCVQFQWRVAKRVQQNVFTCGSLTFSPVITTAHLRKLRGQSQLTAASALRIIDQIHQSRYILVLCHVPDKQASVAALGPKDSVARFLLEVRFVNDGVGARKPLCKNSTSVSSCQLFDPSNEELTVLLSPTRRNFAASFVSFTRPNFH